MRTVRQPTLKTWLWLAVISSIVLAIRTDYRSELASIFDRDLYGVLKTLAPHVVGIGSWLLPFLLPLWIRSSLRIGIFCGLLQLCIGVALMPTFFLEAIVDLVDGSFISFEILLLGITVLGWSIPITDHLLIFTLSDIERDVSLAAFIPMMLVSTIGYGIASYFIAQSYRMRSPGRGQTEGA
jgi:hypothetical protein